jgi:CO/xanthine dehydrogenase FAD-binding subunit
VEARAADELLAGQRLDEELITAAAEAAAKPAKPLDNADLSYVWRKRMVRVVVEQALRKAAAR